MTLGEKLKLAMRLAGISGERELSRLSGVSHGTIHHYTQNRREPSFFRLVKIARACKQGVNYFVDVDELKETPAKRRGTKQRGTTP